MDDGQCGTGAPNEQYFRFMDSLIPGRDILSRCYDPFAIFPLDPATHDDYFEYMPQWDLTIAPGNHIIASQKGAGKTTFCRNLEYSPPDGIFVVYLAPKITDLNHGRFLSNNRALLLNSIAATFWQQIRRLPDFYSFKNPDPAWSRLLCWWFHHFPPPVNGFDKVSETLNQECSDADRRRSDNRLRDAIRLITELRTPLLRAKKLRHLMVALFTVEELKTVCTDLEVNPETIPNHDKDLESFAREIIGSFERRGKKDQLIKALRKERPNANWGYLEEPGASWERAFDHVRLLVESPQDISAEQQCQLIEDVIRLTLSHQRLFATVFIDRRAQFAVWNANRPYWPEISQLPLWRKEDLRMLLWRRLKSSDFPSDWPPPDDPLPKLGNHLTKAAREHFIDTIVEFALGAATEAEAAPIHALRLARRLLAECAQHQAAQPELRPGDLRRLCNLYWNERK